MKFDTSHAGEFGVQAQYLDGKRNLVGYALAGRLHFDPQFQVVWGVVETIAVFVVHVFAFVHWASQQCFHEYAVLVRFLAAAKMKAPVAGRVHVPIFIDRAPLSAAGSAFNRAKTLLHVVAGVFAVFGSAKVTVSDLTTKFALERRREFAVHAASLALAPMVVKEIV